MVFNFNVSDVQKTIAAVMKDASGNPVPLQGYSLPVWSAPAAAGVANCSVVPGGPGGNAFQMQFVGNSGSFDVTATCSRTMSPDISVTATVNVAGPAPDHLDMILLNI